LTKIAYYSIVSHRKPLYQQEESNSPDGDETSALPLKRSETEQTQSFSPYKIHKSARLHFIKFETKHIESCLDFIRGHLTGSKEFMRGKSIKATGGGAYKYADIIQEKLGLT